MREGLAPDYWVVERHGFTGCGKTQAQRSISGKSDFDLWTEHKPIEKLRYIHRNQVKRGLVASPEVWRWSSFRAYVLGEAGPVRVNEWDALKMKIRPPAA